ncbi:MAG TPA: hypothetical protein VMS37_21065, partial [Verrucomicrobiae bacterium]|nr:hypothetical protein [Verrucomicrobiae bacterium]
MLLSWSDLPRSPGHVFYDKLDTSKNLSRRARWADSLVAGRLGVKRWAGSQGSSTWTIGCG